MFQRFLLLLLLFVGSNSYAVSLSATDSGEVLIFPYYSNLGGNQTLLHISTTIGTGDAALKLIFRNRQGEVELSFNLYLSASDTWTAAVARVGNEARLYLPDASCIAPQLSDLQEYAVVDLSSGYIEVIQMGVTDRNVIRISDCDQVVAAWEEGGVWANDPTSAMFPPEAIIRGTSTLINVQEGTLYSFVATALNQFSDIVQNSAPGETIPNLSSAHDSGTKNGQTMSYACNETECFNDSWADPLDAVAAVLLRFTYMASYTTNPAIGASTEVIVTFPLRFYYQQKLEAPVAEMPIHLSVVDQNGQFILFDASHIPRVVVPPTPPLPYSFEGQRESSLEVLSFNNEYVDFGNTVISGILGEDHKVFFPDDYAKTIFPDGLFYLNFGRLKLVANSGNIYDGTAGIGYSLERFVNNQLIDPQGKAVRANYGGANKLSVLVSIRSPQP
ncbi:MAG: hypothetical protein L3J24_04675 [Xanthomonadales bacterium]|nr:hypothetical protein [Xanthomonadales bacterium]